MQEDSVAAVRLLASANEHIFGPLSDTRTVAWLDGQAITQAAFLADTMALAEQLPQDGQPVNLCRNRYGFAVAMMAAMVRGQASLMPPNLLPQTLAALQAADDKVYALLDDSQSDSGGMRAMVSRHRADLAPPGFVPAIHRDAPAVCLMTSGSTGAPRPHPKRWGALQTNIRSQAQRLAEFLQRPSLDGLNLVATVPAQHSYGIESSVLLGLIGRASFHAGQPFFPADVADALASVPRPRALVTTPFHLKTLLSAGLALPPTDLVLSATAPLSQALAAQAELAFGGILVEIYGCTEAGQVASRRTTLGDVWTTLGELHLHGVPDGLSAQGQRFMVSGGHVLEPTPLADSLELLDARHFRLLGRSNDLIHVAGKRSSLANLNHCLSHISGVVDGTFWLPEGGAGEVSRTVAFVVAPGLNRRQILSALRRQIEAAFMPRQVIFVAALPRETSGKLTAQALQEFALTTLAKAGLAGDQR